MSSSAFALPLDQSPGGGPQGGIEHVVPLPPTFERGAIKFRRGWLSLAYDNFGTGPATVDVSVRVIALGGVVRLTETVAFSVGRTVVTEILDGDLTASFQVPPGGGQFPAGTTKPTLAALVEFDD